MKKHLLFYETCMQTGYMHVDGLCRALYVDLIDSGTFELFKPTESDIDELVRKNMLSRDTRDGFWAADMSMFESNRHNKFTTLRQTIVLFMAAINNEL